MGLTMLHVIALQLGNSFLPLIIRHSHLPYIRERLPLHLSLQLVLSLILLFLRSSFVQVLFEQVLFNLLDNASKYARADTTISIRSWRDRETVCLQVLDEGEGIPAADLERIFDKFYRARKGDQVRAEENLRRSFQLDPYQSEVAEELGRMGVMVQIPRKPKSSNFITDLFKKDEIEEEE